MPEGDTVYRLARRLDTALAGGTLARAELRVPRHATADLRGRAVLTHDTHGKHLLTRLSDGLTLHTHLRMSGSWTVVRPGKRLPPPVWPTVRVVLGIADGPTAHGLDLPVVELLRTSDERLAIGHLGPDPLRTDFDPALAAANLSADPRRVIVAALLDQRCIAGLGNLWVNELCFLRGLNPWTPAGDVDTARLVGRAATALRHSAHVPGALQVTTGDTRRGRQHWVAGRAGRPCLRCATPIHVVGEGETGPLSRRTWWCPTCQPAMS